MKILVIGRKGRLDHMSPAGKIEENELTYIDPASPADVIVENGKDAEVIIVDAMYKVPGEAIRKLPKLKMIHSEGVGYQGVDVDAATEQGVYVCNCKGMNATPVAEHAIMLMLGCLRDIISGHEDVLSANQIEKKEAYMAAGSLRELADCRIGLIGFGDIARETARLAAAFGAEVVFWNRSAVAPEYCHGAAQLPLDEVLGTSDILSIHLPVTPETVNFVDDDFLAKMKEGAIFINTSRGELADSAALIRAIESGHLAGAGLDCIAGEPVRKDNILINAPEEVLRKIVFTPHIAGITASSFRRGYAMLWENVDRIARNEKPLRCVNM